MKHNNVGTRRIFCGFAISATALSGCAEGLALSSLASLLPIAVFVVFGLVAALWFSNGKF